MMKFNEKYIQILEKFNQENYNFYIVSDSKILSGWVKKEQADSALNALPVKIKDKAKVVERESLVSGNIDPNNKENWLGGSISNETEE